MMRVLARHARILMQRIRGIASIPEAIRVHRHQRGMSLEQRMEEFIDRASLVAYDGKSMCGHQAPNLRHRRSTVRIIPSLVQGLLVQGLFRLMEAEVVEQGFLSRKRA